MAQDKKRPPGSDLIDENLKRVYQDTLDEQVPDRFQALLDQLKQQDAAKSGPGGAEDK